ncbi:MAG TPA: dihydroorotate dehydrogenase (quinone), partial [Verrucomicrobiae bacterium]|nr:dihydroorotate dehydrogenase (quinone) [Verrucomicrobiae bacterium]
HLDFFVVNVSSPNTPNLRELQDKAALADILAALQEVNHSCATESSTNGAKILPKPIMVKIAPDLSFDALDEILSLVGPRRVAGLVATNTTVARPQTANTLSQRIYAETGGLSGRPLRNRSTEVIRHLFRQSHGSVPIIGVGGIFDANDAWEKVAAGASLLQIYTGLVYEGPAVAAAIVNGLMQQLIRKGFISLEKAVGCEE